MHRFSSIRRWGLVGLAGSALLASFAFAACGGGDDDDDSSSDGSSDSGSVSTGSDEKYVGQICKAMKTFSAGLEKATGDLTAASSEDPDKLLEKFAEPFDQLAKDFGKANPPKDLKEWHTAASKALTNAAKALKDAKGLDALSALDEDPFPDLPAGAEERLTKIADGNKDCQQANFDFDE